MLFGIDILIQQNPSWKQSRIGLVTNHAATTCQLIPSRKALLEKGFNIIKLFSPEHGLDSKGADGAKMKDGSDPLTQLPIISLYNEKLAPNEEDLKDVDLILFDIPDIGCRYYTYLWTMTHVLEACALHKKPLIILDRPNPLSGNMALAEGPFLDEKNCASFIGRWNIPLRHSCTLGELALYFNTTKNVGATLDVITCKDWKRQDFQPDWGISFVPTSPAMQHFNAALLYPGLGLLEATNISEGRGTTKPFSFAGAPWMEPKKLLLLLEQDKTVAVKEKELMPAESKYAYTNCQGIEFYVLQPENFNPVLYGLRFIKLVKELHPEHFSWNTYPTHVNPTGKDHLDKLLGKANSEALFEMPYDEFVKHIKSITTVTNWQEHISPFLLY
ncbi:MAG: DUF1343 domain-containing protein [Bacteroidota bacterium]|nr:DUF1343 domain-containing protein [Bacteroidota bacterium]